MWSIFKLIIIVLCKHRLPHMLTTHNIWIVFFRQLVKLPCLPCSITQAVEVDAYIRETELPLQTEDIVRVCQEHWTVKPSRTKRLVTPDNERADSSEWGSQGSRTEEESTGKESTEVNGATAVSSLSYICRPNHRQSPHSGGCVYQLVIVAWGNSLLLD